MLHLQCHTVYIYSKWNLENIVYWFRQIGFLQKSKSIIKCFICWKCRKWFLKCSNQNILFRKMFLRICEKLVITKSQIQFDDKFSWLRIAYSIKISMWYIKRKYQGCEGQCTETFIYTLTWITSFLILFNMRRAMSRCERC